MLYNMLYKMAYVLLYNLLYKMVYVLLYSLVFYLACQRLDYVLAPMLCLRNAIITIIDHLYKRVGWRKVSYVQCDIYQSKIKQEYWQVQSLYELTLILTGVPGWGPWRPGKAHKILYCILCKIMHNLLHWWIEEEN